MGWYPKREMLFDVLPTQYLFGVQTRSKQVIPNSTKSAAISTKTEQANSFICYGTGPHRWITTLLHQLCRAFAEGYRSNRIDTWKLTALLAMALNSHQTLCSPSALDGLPRLSTWIVFECVNGHFRWGSPGFGSNSNIRNKNLEAWPVHRSRTGPARNR